VNRTAAPAAGRGATRRPAKRILVVEDDELTRQMLTDLLTVEGYPAEAVANGAEALAQLRRGPAPDLILLDLLMPVMDRWTFRDERSADPALASIPVVVISATTDVAADPDRPLRAAAYLRKPITVETLLQAVRYC